ncbi:hypothetical protein [Caenibius sp. WL]|uniref:hypothetical protein n=1 Tax=Caenibius sp. WL TaxID=2872646 RepID=UPI001C9A1CF0|nr:hypothetical protein [Caenibius sp. WL]QZP07803.1 hypothetical protein K5X80_14290 [Caenibius sp. WL]QZP09965.1 hypothetical protein K5X80_16915 [Caenibius sp. WL]
MTPPVTTPTAEELALARKIVGRQLRMEPEDITWWNELPEVQAALSAIRETTVKVIKLAEQQQQDFLSPEYATGQPLSSFQERFACGQIAEALRSNAHLKGEAHDG